MKQYRALVTCYIDSKMRYAGSEFESYVTSDILRNLAKKAIMEISIAPGTPVETKVPDTTVTAKRNVKRK